MFGWPGPPGDDQGMILCIGDVLEPAGLGELRSTIAAGVFVDGVLSSGWASRLVKNNEQLGAGPALAAAQQKVIAALRANPVFASAVMPRSFAPATLSKGRQRSLPTSSLVAGSTR